MKLDDAFCAAMEPDVLPLDALKSQQDEAHVQDVQDLEPLACVSCRARKLKCDRTKPACARCVKIQHECLYPESRRKPTFKRRNVKELEARLGTYIYIYLKHAFAHRQKRHGAGRQGKRKELWHVG